MTEADNSREGTGGECTLVAEFPAVSGYEILDELGQGGMGIVYQARQLSTQRRVALKLIRTGALASPQDRARLRIEAEAISRLQHPNIVQILEFGEHLGQPFLVMESIDGGRLDHHLGGHPMPTAAAAAMVRTLAEAIQHSHDQKIIHRDLKPANILLRPLNLIARDGDITRNPSLAIEANGHGPFIPVITDFGLAKRLDGDSTVLTHAGAILGTASYMSPEQADGRGREIGPGADIYALGVILYELLTGRPPFRANSWRETIEQLIRDDPSRPSAWGVDVPDELETICLKCLEKEPDSRYSSAAELARELERFLSGQSIRTPIANEKERIGRRAARDGYTIVAEVGRGPRSTVYQTTFGPLQQSMALKVFDRDVCTESEWNARLDRGTQVWSTLTHPQVGMVRHAGWWDGTPFVSMEFAPQKCLAEASSNRQYSIRTALQLIEQLLVVVCYLHRQGVVHGNLKPSNVLLAADGIPRVVDFRALSGLSFGELPATDDSRATFACMAPELLADPTCEVGPWADIYGVGAILYELLAGRPLFVASNAAELSNQIQSSTPEPLSTFHRDVSPELDAFCQRCLNKSPWSRYARAYGVLIRVREFLTTVNGSTLARPKRN